MSRHARGLTCLLAAAALGGLAGGQRANGVVGGRRIPIRDAPWTVVIRLSSDMQVHCTGVLIGPARVVTAAHCLYGHWGLRRPDRLTVTAGVSNYLDPRPGDAPQTRPVASLRVHPAYGRHAYVDDIAVLELARPFRLGSAVRAVRLPVAGEPYPAGAATTILGFGQQHGNVDTPTGALVAAPATIYRRGVCGAPPWLLIPLNAVLVCARAPGGAACYGDSGAPLVTAGTQPVLVGILSQLRGRACVRGTAAIYTYVGAPEIRRFLAGDRHPPAAPRLSTASIKLHYHDPIHVGDLVACHVDWLRSATRILYTFTTQSGKVLQSGRGRTYRVTPQAVGADLVCVVEAANAGGTAVAGKFLTTVQT